MNTIKKLGLFFFATMACCFYTPIAKAMDIAEYETNIEKLEMEKQKLYKEIKLYSEKTKILTEKGLENLNEYAKLQILEYTRYLQYSMSRITEINSKIESLIREMFPILEPEPLQPLRPLQPAEPRVIMQKEHSVR
jgi:hypothetical protein